MKFAEPYWIFIGLFACAAIALLYMRFDRWQRSALSTFAAGHLLKQLTVSYSRRRTHLKRTLFLIGVALLFVVLSRPQWGYRWEETKRRGIDILFAVDTSKSMLAQDIKPDRLTRAKLAVTDLVSKLEGDRVGLIAFAGSAFLQSPLTLDYDAFRQSLDALDTEIIPRGGTNVASAIREAQQTFAASENQKIVVLITDGEDLEAKGVQAATAAAKAGLKVYTVGVGSASGELIPAPDANGGTEFAKDESGQLVKSRLDEAALQEIAQATGGMYQALGQQGQGLETIYQQALAPLPKQELMSRRQKVYIERFQWPLLAGLACLLLEMIIGTRKAASLRSRRFVPLPARFRLRGLKPAHAAAAVALIALPSVVDASPQSAERAYEKGNFKEAQEQYKQAAEKHPDTAALQFNLGAAAYKAGEFDKAVPAFQKTLQSDQLNVQQLAYYNLGNTQFRLGQKSAEEKPEETIKTWEEALQSYEAALKLKPDDADAKFNRDLVKKKLEELKKKQQQDEQKKQQQDQKNQQQKKDEQKGGKENQKDQQNGGEQKQENQPQSGQKDQKDQQQNGKGDQAPQPENKKEGGDQKDQQQAAGKQGEKPKDEKKDGKGEQQPQLAKNETKAGGEQSAPSPSPSPSQEQRQAEERANPGEMSKQEARALLDSLQRGDRRMPVTPADGGADTPENSKPTKDW